MEDCITLSYVIQYLVCTRRRDVNNYFNASSWAKKFHICSLKYIYVSVNIHRYILEFIIYSSVTYNIFVRCISFEKSLQFHRKEYRVVTNAGACLQPFPQNLPICS